MQATTAEVESRFDEFLDLVQEQPIVIEEEGRPRAVMLAYDEYDRLQRMDDYFWGKRALEAEKEGFVGHEESMRFIRERLEYFDRVAPEEHL